MGICGCGDRCTCSLVSGNTNLVITGSGDAVDPYVLTVSTPTFAASNTDGLISITPGGTAGHEPVIDLNVCDLFDTGTTVESGLPWMTPNAGCLPRPMELAPATDYVLGANADLEVAWKQVLGGGNSGGVPVGAVFGFAGTVAPTGYLICDGSAISRATYADLFAAISTSYGVGDGSTTFNLPDGRGRSQIGLGTHLDVNSLSDNDGLAVGSRTPKHTHSVPSLTVAATGNNTNVFSTQAPGSGVEPTATGAGAPDLADSTHTHNTAIGAVAVSVSGTTGTGTTGSANGGYLVTNTIIFTGV